MKKYMLYIILFSLLSLFSCQNNSQKKDGKSHLPHSVGTSSEILVVMNKGFWEGAIGDTVKIFFRQPYPGLPQAEPYYTLPNVNLNSLSNNMFNKHRNIFVVDINADYSKPHIETKTDVWAYPQRVIKINAPTQKDFYQLFNEYKWSFFRMYHDSELRRIQLTFKSAEDVTLRNNLMRKYGISLTLPTGYYMAKSMSDFVWIRRETKDYSQGIMIKFEPYKQESQFSEKQIMLRRNAMTRMHIPGPSDGSYMKISEEFPVTRETKKINNRYTIVTRGWWELENDFMGGPFINYTFFDSINNRLVNLDAFVYAPGQKKKNKILQLEAVLKDYKLNKVEEEKDK